MSTERLPRLPQNTGLFLPSGKPTQTMQRWWERVCEEIEFGRSRMDDIQNQIVKADHAGVVLTGELPRNITCKRYFLETDVTTSSTWSVSVTSGSIGTSIGAATGALTLSAVSGTIAAVSVVKVTSVRQGLTLTKSFTVTRVDNSPPASGGGGGTSASDSTFNSINSTTHAAISDELTVTVGSAGTVTLSAPLSVRTAAASPSGTFEVFMKWQWWDGAAWVDLAAEVASNPDCEVVFESEINTYLTFAGSISVPDSKTGLAASSSQKFRLMARNASGTRTMTFTGTASAVAS